MKMHLFSYAVLTAILVAALPSAIAQDKKEKAPSPEELEMMKKWEAAATPGAGHKTLAPLAGEWEVSSKWWMDPSQPPMESKGKSKSKWILGGRYLQDEYEGEFMGKPMKGMSLTGYDNFKKKYSSLWIDDMGTAMFHSEGVASDDGKTFTFTGKMDDVTTGEKDKTMKWVIRLVSDKKYVFEMYDASKNKDTKCAEMVYTKK